MFEVSVIQGLNNTTCKDRKKVLSSGTRKHFLWVEEDSVNRMPQVAMASCANEEILDILVKGCTELVEEELELERKRDKEEAHRVFEKLADDIKRIKNELQERVIRELDSDRLRVLLFEEQPGTVIEKAEFVKMFNLILLMSGVALKHPRVNGIVSLSSSGSERSKSGIMRIHTTGESRNSTRISEEMELILVPHERGLKKGKSDSGPK
jgi:hypothetical protein